MDIKQNPRDQRIPVMLSKEEKATLQIAAREVGLNLSTYMRAQAIIAAIAAGD